ERSIDDSRGGIEADLITGDIDVATHLVYEIEPGVACEGESEVCRARIRILRVGEELHEGAVLGACPEHKRAASRVDAERSVDGYVAADRTARDVRGGVRVRTWSERRGHSRQLRPRQGRYL